MKTVFDYSGSGWEGLRDEVYESIMNDGIHPVRAFADVINKSIDSSRYGVKDSAFLVRKGCQDSYKPDRFFFPNPSKLMEVCLGLGVHPADLLPEEFRDEPAPRSVLQVCRHIAEDERFPHADQTYAIEFLERERQLIEEFSRDNPSEARYFGSLNELLYRDSPETLFIDWDRHGCYKNSDDQQENRPRLKLADMFETSTVNFDYAPLPDTLYFIEKYINDSKFLDGLDARVKLANHDNFLAFEALKEIGDKLFGQGRAMEIYEKTKPLFTNDVPAKDGDFKNKVEIIQELRLTVKPSDIGPNIKERLIEAWLKACEKYYKVERESAGINQVLKYEKQSHDTIADLKMYNGEKFERALAIEENSRVIEGPLHVPYGWNEVVEAHFEQINYHILRGLRP